MKRRLTLLLLTVLLLLSMSAGALAQAQKDEVVYARLDLEGVPTGVYLINAFEAGEETRVVDYGAYTEAFPLGSVTGFSYQNGEAAFTMPAGRFSYQGTLESLALPWLFAMSYTLDGQPVEAAALSGASGRLEGRLRVRINEELRQYANSLSLQVTLSLDSDNCLNIRSDKATHALAGGSRTLSYVVLPGQEADYTFSADVHDFHMAGVQIAGVRMGMDTAMYQASAAAALAGSPLEGAVSGLMANFLEGMQGQPSVSFTDARNPVRSLQFVLMGEEIPAPAPPPDTAEAQAPQTFWQRLLNIFKP